MVEPLSIIIDKLMARNRSHCIVCGKGFLSNLHDPIIRQKFNRKKCAIKYYSKDWKPAMWLAKIPDRTLEEKIKIAQTL